MKVRYGIGRTVRNGLNFTERDFGVRGAVGVFGVYRVRVSYDKSTSMLLYNAVD